MSILKKSFFWIAGITLILILIIFISYQYQERQTKKSVEKIDDIFSKQKSSMKYETDERREKNPDKNAYFGDLHVHTANSFDSYTFGNINSPDDAYRYARGAALPHPSGYQIQLKRPLDFYAVTDHGIFLGVMKSASDENSFLSKYDWVKPLHNLNDSAGAGIFEVIRRSNLFRPFAQRLAEEGRLTNDLTNELNKISSSVWQDIIQAADRAYEPGVLTTFAGYEYSAGSGADLTTLHRNVIFKDTKNLPLMPFSRVDSPNPEKLWDWMDSLRNNGVESMAIPHNSNLSGGLMFMLDDFNGAPIDESYSRKRISNEPVVEITQVKASSETSPFLSKNDEWADFEIENTADNDEGSYTRSALLRGMALKNKSGVNPYKFGFIGSTDTHVSASSFEEDRYFSKIGILDGTPELRGSIPFNKTYGSVLKVLRPNLIAEVDGKDYFAGSNRLISWSASGLAGVWAEENTRESIFNAFKRKETFATSGPRIKIRFFAGYDIENAFSKENAIAYLYETASTMGGSLKTKKNKSPTFLVWAMADAQGTNLQRVQIIKGWLDNGESKEKVYDATCSDGLEVDKSSHRCPDNGAKVNLNDCSISKNKGSRELKTLWKDPEFIEDQEAFYYVRVLENPVCRWSTWDAIRSNQLPRSDIKSTIQERAWSSPIWITNY